MTDRSGKEVAVGQTIDIHLSGMFTARIIDVREAPLVLGGRGVPPQVAIQLLLSHVPADGRQCGFYIVLDAEEPAAVPSVIIQ